MSILRRQLINYTDDRKRDGWTDDRKNVNAVQQNEAQQPITHYFTLFAHN